MFLLSPEEHRSARHPCVFIRHYVCTLDPPGGHVALEKAENKLLTQTQEKTKNTERAEPQRHETSNRALAALGEADNQTTILWLHPGTRAYALHLLLA